MVSYHPGHIKNLTCINYVWLRILALGSDGHGFEFCQAFTSRVTLGKLLNLPSSQFPHLQSGNKGST